MSVYKTFFKAYLQILNFKKVIFKILVYEILLYKSIHFEALYALSSNN